MCVVDAGDLLLPLLLLLLLPLPFCRPSLHSPRTWIVQRSHN